MGDSHESVRPHNHAISTSHSHTEEN